MLGFTNNSILYTSVDKSKTTQPNKVICKCRKKESPRVNTRQSSNAYKTKQRNLCNRLNAWTKALKENSIFKSSFTSFFLSIIWHKSKAHQKIR